MVAPEDQELYDLIIKRDWDGALALIDPSRYEEKQELLDKVNSGDVSPLILILKNYDDMARDLCLKLIDIGGEDLVNISDDDGSALHCACGFDIGDMEVIRRLVEVGGIKLISLPEKYDGQTALYRAHYPEDARVLVEAGGKELVLKKDNCGRTVLHTILRFLDHDVMDTFRLLLEVGGEELVMVTDRDHRTALHYAFDSMTENEINRQIVHDMLEVGGRKLVLLADRDGRTALHDACICWESYPESVSHLLAIGGEKLAMTTDRNGKTALHDACEWRKELNAEVYRQLLEVGREKLLLMSDRYGSTALHLASNWMWKHNPEIFRQMLDLGKEKLLFMADNHGKTALHKLCSHTDELHPEAVELVLELGGEDILLKTDFCGKTALHYVCHTSNSTSNETSDLNSVSSNTSNQTSERQHLLNKIETVYHMLDMGRMELLLVRDLGYRTAMQIELRQENPSEEIIDRFIEIAGNDFLLDKLSENDLNNE